MYGEEEEEIAAKSEDPIMKEIWENKIAVVDINVKPVFQGKQALINWVSIFQHSFHKNYRVITVS